MSPSSSWRTRASSAPLGEIDFSTVAALKREVDAAREQDATVLLDMSGVTFIDSSGLHFLLEASQRSAVSDWAFFVAQPSRSSDA